MLENIKQAIGASVVAGVSALAVFPATAASINPTSLTGNFLLYDSYGTQTIQTSYTGLEQVATILQGNATSPTGNIELFADSETSTYKNLSTFYNAPVTTLTGTILGNPIILSSLTGKDWFGESLDTNYYTAGSANSTFAASWFNSILDANGFQSAGRLELFNKFLTNGGFQRFSDANISYVTQANASSPVLIGLAGHYDATNLLIDVLTGNSKNELIRKQALASINLLRSPDKRNTAIQISEVIKITYGGKTELRYSTTATKSGLTAKDDGISHNGNYEISVDAVEAVPEPTTILGIAVGLSGLFAAKRKQQKANIQR
ncbi:MAG: NF038130 family PEP-CTERM protein [Oscillatoriaceae bacterium SKW80]|nr:NF038130 family PEP-CTERM protein [Oscillatoriaceae bacterium SKYG93]MCX8119310.1 NF038130 family PEP-CTERM protein [Oscillatoriaceae bacterium SKW80]MDW8454777.1 NF038130 family PEP-CTERM protein [Oscillatoriaceae cyanobacterium SKYGB_i_bin93]HIK28442.1 NF038130 family PEP-CTERM protein [Oscillatoriaceae cyanobacterium M7585_C2015_266]